MQLTGIRYSNQEICEVVQGNLLQLGAEIFIQHLFIDSRKTISPSNSCFIAIKGPLHDGHRYITELYEKGVYNFIITSNSFNIHQYPQASFIQVNDAIKALQDIVSFHRSHFQLKSIGITGSNGKTTVKEWLYQLISSEFSVVKSPKSYNSQVGVPLAVWQIKHEHEIGLFEAGISQKNEMRNLAYVIQPHLVIFTNIGAAHDEGFKNRKEKIHEKLQLVAVAKQVIYCKDYDLLEQEMQLLEVEKICWSTKDEEAPLFIKCIEFLGAQTKIMGIYKGQEAEIMIPFLDKGSIENAIHCWLAALELGLAQQEITSKMQTLLPVAMRLDSRSAEGNSVIINDAYNSDIESLSIALDYLSQQANNQSDKSKTVILSDIFQNSNTRESLYQEVNELLQQNDIQNFIGIGEGLAKYQSIIKCKHKVFYSSTNEFLKYINKKDFRDQVILLKGARPFQFEKVANFLEKKTHDTVLEINLNAISNNLKAYKKILSPDIKIMAMVKAFSYGTGGYEVAKVLQNDGIDYLAVAYADEGVELRKSGIHTPILILNVNKNNFSTILEYDLEPEIYSLELLNSFNEYILSHLSKTPYPIHLKIDTGMHRLGFIPEDFPMLIDTIQSNQHLMVASVFTHLASSDNPMHDSYTQQQFQLFEHFCTQLSRVISYPYLRHVLNSNGITRFPEYQMDMVRLGLGLYGVDASGTIQQQLQPVSELRTIIAQKKKIKKGESVGYDRSFVASKDMYIGIINIGYADGIDRRLSNGVGEVLLKGKRVPMIGKVCMDMVMIDVSEADVQVGDPVVIFNNELTVSEIAQKIDTIPYEVLAGISQRVKRVYYQE